MVKIIVAHPNKQHSYYTATGLNINENLDKYITTVYDKTGSLVYKIKGLLKGKNFKRASGRKCDSIEDEQVIQFCEASGLFSLLLSKFPALSKLREYHRRYFTNRFGKKVARYAVKNKADAVIMYDSTANSCFKYLRRHAPNIKRILDVSIATRGYMKDIFEEDIQKTGIADIKREQWILWDKAFLENEKKEINSTQYFLVPSSFVKKSLLFYNVHNERIKTVPYGVDTSLFRINNINEGSEKPLRLIYVGYISYRKGIHHLLNVVSQYHNTEVNITLCGDYDFTSPLYTDFKDVSNIRFAGFVTRDQLTEAYQKADAFVLFTQGEGLAQVGEEALACGLPIITTEYSGVNDLIENGVNGFVVDYNESALRQCIDWCKENIDELHNMKVAARKTAEKYSLQNYYVCLNKAISEIMGG